MASLLPQTLPFILDSETVVLSGRPTLLLANQRAARITAVFGSELAALQLATTAGAAVQKATVSVAPKATTATLGWA